MFGAAKHLSGKNSVALGDCRRPLPALDEEARSRLDEVWERLQANIALTVAEERDA